MRASTGSHRKPIHFLDRILADIAEPEVSGETIERDPPRIADPYLKDLRESAHAGRVRIAGRDCVGIRAAVVDVDAQDLPQQRRLVLSIADGAVRFVGAATIAHADVKEAVGTELDCAAVVIGLRLRDRKQNRAGQWIGDVRIERTGQIAGNDRGAIGLARVVDVELAVRCILWMKRESQQSLLTVRRDHPAQIDERCGLDQTVLDESYCAGLLHDEEPLAAVVRLCNLDRRGKAGIDLVPSNRSRGRRRTERARQNNNRNEEMTGDRREHAKRSIAPLSPDGRELIEGYFFSASRISRSRTISSGGAAGGCASRRAL